MKKSSFHFAHNKLSFFVNDIELVAYDEKLDTSFHYRVVKIYACARTELCLSRGAVI